MDTVSHKNAPAPDIGKKFLRHKLPAADITEFQKLILTHYRKHGRDLPWRKTTSPYAILVSEIMLQQTQVDRVIPKYTAFMKRFPDVNALARAPLRQILALWSGLGYNRRAIALKKAAEDIVQQHGGNFPEAFEELIALPGIGAYTASAVSVFAYNQPRTFIETNIRAVYIHFFFPHHHQVHDTQILPLIEKTLYKKNPRRWYNALMDYGVAVKKLLENPGRKSAHYSRQSPFKGSDREIRGLLLKTLLNLPACTEKKLIAAVGKDPEKVKNILRHLQNEGFIKKQGTTLCLA